MKTQIKTFMGVVSFLGVFTTVDAQPAISIARYAGGRQAAVSYTFDDGLQEHYTKVFPYLKKKGLKATFCVVGSKMGKNMKGTPCMTWNELKTMAANGQEISNHGWGHKAVIHLTGESLRAEVQRNDTAIYTHTGVFPRTYFYPGNRKTPEALSFCAKDRVGTRTQQVSIGSKRDTTWLKHWVDKLIAQGQWGVGMTHGITTGYDAFPDQNVLWRHLDYVSGLQDKLWIATFHDVAAYTTERDSTKLNVKKTAKYISVEMKSPLDGSIFNYPLTLQVESASVTKAVQHGRNVPLRHKGEITLLTVNPNGGEIKIYERQ